MRYPLFLCIITSFLITAVRAADSALELKVISSIVSSLRTLPNCQFTYLRREGRMQEPELVSLQDQLRPSESATKSYVVDQLIHFSRFNECFDVKVMEGGKLLRRICYDGATYYYSERYHDKVKLRVGRPDEVMDRVMSVTLMNSPLFVQFRPLSVMDKTHFYFPFLADIKHWSDLASLYKVNIGADNELFFSRELNDVKTNILYSSDMNSFPLIRLEKENKIIAEFKIMEAIPLSAEVGLGKPAFLLPVKYLDGLLESPAVPKVDSSYTEVVRSSIKELKLFDKGDFIISKAEADTIVDTTLGMKTVR